MPVKFHKEPKKKEYCVLLEYLNYLYHILVLSHIFKEVLIELTLSS